MMRRGGRGGGGGAGGGGGGAGGGGGGGAGAVLMLRTPGAESRASSNAHSALCRTASRISRHVRGQTRNKY